MKRVEYLLISPGHNFFGHHGQAPGEHPILAVDRLECVAGRGIRGDRFFDFKADYKGQITFFDMEVLDALERDLQLSDVRPEVTRRNAFVRGLELNSLVGSEFELQGIRFAGAEECRPCYWMNNAFRDARVSASKACP